MSFLSRVGGQKPKAKVFVLGLDGVPYSFLVRRFERGELPNLKALAGSGRFARMTSVIPTISSVAWSTYMTGKNPGKHGIYGFVDRKPGSYDVFVPTSVNLAGPTLWDLLGAAGLRVVVINVPVTYPPRPVNGVLVSDFLCTSLDKVAYPLEVGAWLKGMGYRIDADAKLARTSPERFLEDIGVTLDRRFEAAFGLMESRPWDFFQLHVMETDRINHFLWPLDEAAPGEAFDDFYRRLDRYVGETVRRLPEGTFFLLMSDHGFCPVKQEVYLNQYLADKGLLVLPPGQGLPHLLQETRAYSLIPGRIYLNLRGREPRGSVDPGAYEATRSEVARVLLELRDPDDGSRVIRKVLPGEELYRGNGPLSFPVGLGRDEGICPPDLVAVPFDGYDLKGNVGKGVFGRTELKGMHTFDDAFLLAAGEGPPVRGVPGIADVMPSLLRRCGVPVPADLDGQDVAF